MNEELIERIKTFVSRNAREYEYSEKISFLTSIYEAMNICENDHEELIITNYYSPAFDMRVDGYDYVSDERIDMFVSDYNFEATLDDEIVKCLQDQMLEFWNEAHDDLYASLDDGTEEYDLAVTIYNNAHNIKRLTLNIVTGRKYNGNKLFSSSNDRFEIVTRIIDIDDINEFGIFHDNGEDNQNYSVNIDFENDPFVEGGIQAVKGNFDFDKIDTYLFFMPAYTLASIYHDNGFNLLDGNVRSFLKKTSKYNKGIYNTIKEEPEMFVSYNNGLSTVATNIDIDDDNFISAIYGWKIVNGGQTTATIYEAYKSSEDLSDVYVPVKLTLIKNVGENSEEETEELISNISRYANSQSKVNESDISSNEIYHIEIEKLSKQISIPSSLKGRSFIKWYYERIKGKYDFDKERDSSGTFEDEFPKSKKFNKVDLAKAIMAWQQEPHTVCMGGEKCFYTFNARARNTFDIDTDYYKRIVACLILFKTIDNVAKEQGCGSLKSNVTSYTMSYLSFITNKTLDLLSIWDEQEVDEDLCDLIRDIVDEVFETIKKMPKNQTNVSMWCRKQGCWNNVKELNFDPDDYEDYIVEDAFDFVDSSTTVVNENGEEIEIEDIELNDWQNLYEWCNNNDGIIPTRHVGMIKTCINYAKNSKNLSDKQKAFAKGVLMEAIEKGFKI